MFTSSGSGQKKRLCKGHGNYFKEVIDLMREEQKEKGTSESKEMPMFIGSKEKLKRFFETYSVPDAIVLDRPQPSNS